MASEAKATEKVDAAGGSAATKAGAATVPPSTGRGEKIAKAGTLLSAIMASSCCWLPLLLLAVGVSGAGIASALETYRPAFMVVTFGFLGAAFYFTYRPHPAAGAADCCAPKPAPGATAHADCCAPQPDSEAAPADCCAPQPVEADCCAPAARTGKWRISPMALNKAMLWVVTGLAVLFLFFPGYVSALIGPEDRVTDDMQRSVLVVDGMTCEGCAPTAATAIRKAPGILAVEVDYPTKRAVVGTEKGQPVPRKEILASLESIGYSGAFVEE